MTITTTNPAEVLTITASMVVLVDAVDKKNTLQGVRETDKNWKKTDTRRRETEAKRIGRQETKRNNIKAKEFSLKQIILAMMP